MISAQKAQELYYRQQKRLMDTKLPQQVYGELSREFYRIAILVIENKIKKACTRCRPLTFVYVEVPHSILNPILDTLNEQGYYTGVYEKDVDVKYAPISENIHYYDKSDVVFISWQPKGE